MFYVPIFIITAPSDTEFTDADQCSSVQIGCRQLELAHRAAMPIATSVLIILPSACTGRTS